MARNRYTVYRDNAESSKDAEADDYLLVKVNDEPDFKRVSVWRNFRQDGTVDVSCASCSTPLRGMSASCVHATAAKRATINGTVRDEKRPAWWKPWMKPVPKRLVHVGTVHAKHQPVTTGNVQNIPNTTTRRPSDTKLEVRWKMIQPPVGPAFQRAYVGPHKVGGVSMSMERNGGYEARCFLPGATPVPSMYNEAQAIAEVERVVRLWFEDIPNLEIL